MPRLLERVGIEAERDQVVAQASGSSRTSLVIALMLRSLVSDTAHENCGVCWCVSVALPPVTTDW